MLVISCEHKPGGTGGSPPGTGSPPGMGSPSGAHPSAVKGMFNNKIKKNK